MKTPLNLILPLILAILTLTGCDDSENFVFTNTNVPDVPVPPVLQAPVAFNDAFPALGGATLNQAAPGVLGNDTVNGATVTSFDVTGSNGGTLNLNANGSFTYTPATGVVGQDTFDYTLTNTDGASTATVTLTSTAFGRFVDNSGANGTGTQASPFNNLADAVAVAQNGDTIYVASGDGNNTGVPGGFLLPVGVALVGEGTGLILGQTIEPAGSAPIINGPITCAGDNLIQGFTIDGSTDELIRISSTTENVTVDHNTLINPTSEHFDCDNAGGTILISNNTLDFPPDDSSMDHIRLNNSSVDGTFSVTGNTFMNTGQNSSNVNSLFECSATGTSELSLTCSNNIANGTVADEFDFGFNFENNGTGDCTMQISDNQLSNFNEYPIGFFACPGPLTGTVSGNIITHITERGLWLYAGGGTQTVSGNVIANTTTGMDLQFDGTADGTFVATNNNISDSATRAVLISEQDNDTDNKVALRMNTFSTTVGDNDVQIFMNDNGTICCDITDNTFNKDLLLDNQGTGSITIERFGDVNSGATLGDELKTINTFVGTILYGAGSTNVVDGAPDVCAIP